MSDVALDNIYIMNVLKTHKCSVTSMILQNGYMVRFERHYSIPSSKELKIHDID